MFVWGAVFWAAFAVAGVFIRGVRWDENYEFAQAMIGQVEYPAGHPLFCYTRGVYNLQFYAAALQLWLMPSAFMLNAIRNVLFVLATVIPPYFLGAYVTRKAIWGHVAVALVLTGIHLEFDGSYPQFLWPGMFSNGHFGVGYSLLLLCLIVGKKWKWGYFLLGLMPCIHLGQMPPLLAFGVVYSAIMLRAGHGQKLKAAFMWMAVGLGLCIAFFFVQQYYKVDLPSEGAFFSDANVRAVWEGRIAFHDLHRRIPVGNCHIPVVGTIVLGIALSWVSLREKKINSNVVWLAFYALVVSAVVYCSMLIHLIAGTEIPYVFLVWQPYRLLNHIPILLIALCLAALSLESARGKGGVLLIACALIFLVLRPFLEQVAPEFVAERFLHTRESVMFLLWGGAIVSVWREIEGRKRQWLVIAVPLFCLLAWYHQFGAACVFVGGLSVLALRSIENPCVAYKVSMAACVLLVIGILHTQFKVYEQLPRSEFDIRAESRLESLGDGNAMIVGSPYQVLLQARTGHPVMCDMATPYHSSYVPILGPAINKMYMAIYGIDFRLPAPAEDGGGTWKDVWRTRSAAEWRSIADEYDFDYVISPPDVVIDAEVLETGDCDVLYRIRDSQGVFDE